MKTNFWKFAALLGLGLAAMVACEKQPEPTVEPVFPETVLEENVESGATVEVSFEANLADWKLSISPNESNKCWFDDAGVVAGTMGDGKVGAKTVSVVFSEDEYFDQNVVYEVILTMGGKSQVIAKLTRLAINRSLEVYVAEKTEWSFKSTYGTEKATALPLSTFAGNVTYALPIKVVANYDWNLALPVWCAGSIKEAETLSGKAGQAVEILLSGVLTENVKDGAEGFAKFFDAADNSQVVELPLNLPAFASRVDYLDKFDETFEADGLSSTQLNIVALDGLVIKALEHDGKNHANTWADWVTYENLYEAESTESFFKDYFIKIQAEENASSSTRVVDVFAFPASVYAKIPADDLSGLCVSDDLCTINDKYEQYRIGRITQKGAVPSFITIYHNAEDEFDEKNIWKATFGIADDTNWWGELHSSINNLSSNNKYSLVYYDRASCAVFEFASEYASYKIYDYYEGEISKEAEESYWMAYTEFAGKGKVEMWPNTYVAPEHNPSADPQAFVVFFDEKGNALAAVLCTYSKGVSYTITSMTEGVFVEKQSEYSELYTLINNALSAAQMGSTQNIYMVSAEVNEALFESSFMPYPSMVVQFDENRSFVQCEDTFVSMDSMSSFIVSTSEESCERVILFMDNDGNVILAIFYSKF